MNTVYIKFYMKSGREMIGIYKTNNNGTVDIAEELFKGIANNTFSGMYGYDQSQLFICTSEVEAFNVSGKPFDKKEEE